MRGTGAISPSVISAVSAGAHPSNSNGRLHARGTDRSAFLATVAARRAQFGPAEYPFVRQVAAQLCEHDDRGQFLAGVDLILAGCRNCPPG